MKDSESPGPLVTSVKSSSVPSTARIRKKIPLLVKKKPQSETIQGVKVLHSKKLIVKALPPEPEKIESVSVQNVPQNVPQKVGGITVIKKKYTGGINIDFDESKFRAEEPDDIVSSNILTEDADVKQILQRMDPKGKCDKEELIDKLETVKHELRKRISQCKGDPKLLEEYQRVMRVLCDVKEKDLNNKIDTNKAERTIIIQKFKKKNKKLSTHEFERIINLTAPKEERKPEPGMVIWKHSKDITFKDNRYRRADSEKVHKFKKNNRLKKLPSDMKKQMKDSFKGNLQNFHIRKNHSNLMNYQKYNPLDYKGLNYF